jgi:hypothetical protein
MQNCINYCSKVYEKLSSDERLLKTCLKLEPLKKNSFNFKIKFPQNLPFTHFSVSVPPDAIGNRENDEGPLQIESLFLNGRDGVYNDTHSELYDDVWRCGTPEEMVNEILRVYKVFLLKNNEISKPKISKPEIPNPLVIPNLK